MTDQEQSISLSEFVRDASKILDELQATGSEILLEDQGRIFRITPRQKARRRKRFDRQDPLFALGGAFASADETDIANDKHEAIASAYEKSHHSSVGFLLIRPHTSPISTPKTHHTVHHGA